MAWERLKITNEVFASVHAARGIGGIVVLWTVGQIGVQFWGFKAQGILSPSPSNTLPSGRMLLIA